MCVVEKNFTLFFPHSISDGIIKLLKSLRSMNSLKVKGGNLKSVNLPAPLSLLFILSAAAAEPETMNFDFG